MFIHPNSEVIKNSHIKNYEDLYNTTINNPEKFWEGVAGELSWSKKWDKVLDWKAPYARWFVGAKCNIVENALDRHLNTQTAGKLALIWEGQDQTVRKYTYKELSVKVSKFANALLSLDVKKGDRVCIYLPRVPEQYIAMLACAKIGAVHCVVYSGFSATALEKRILDSQAKVLITANAYPYGEKIIKSKENVDTALIDGSTIEHVVVVNRLEDEKVEMKSGRDVWWHELMESQSDKCETVQMEATDPLFILYTSGTTGTPKGIVHAHGGYMVGIYLTLKWVFNLNKDDVYFCTADAGWITGHSYIVYSPLINGVTTFVYEGTPTYPDPGIWWKLIEKYKVTKFYTAPTAIRALEKFGEEYPKKSDLSSLQILGTVGEPINPEPWAWYHKYIGGDRCPVMDTWWQTETGMFMLTPLPSVDLKPGSAFKPFFGVEADVVDDKGKSVPVGTEGFLVIKKPWPSMMLDVYNNSKRYKEAYFDEIKGVYFTGDSAKIDKDGYFWIIGRNDDVIKVSGHRLGSAELESAFVEHEAVSEAAVIGVPDDIKGESIRAFVILRVGHKGSPELEAELRTLMRIAIGPIASPDKITFVDKLPKTRSGKIMRRVLKAQETGQPVGDTSTLDD